MNVELGEKAWIIMITGFLASFHWQKQNSSIVILHNKGTANISGKEMNN